MANLNCRNCNKHIGKSTYRIGCSGGCKGWFHSQCAQLTRTQIEEYLRDKKAWLCVSCKEGSKKRLSVAGPSNAFSVLDHEDVNPRKSNDMESGCNISQILSKTEPDLKDVIKIVNELFNVIQKQNSTIQSLLYEIGEMKSHSIKMTELETQLEDLRSEVNHLKASNNQLGEGQSFEPILKEFYEREKKKANFIIFGKEDRNSEDSPEDDKKMAEEIIKLSHQDSPVDTSTIRVHRLGKYFHGKNRPLRVICNSPDVASKVLHNTRSITNNINYERISVRSDKTYAQLQDFRKVKQELNDRLAAGETNLKIIHRDGFPSIVKHQTPLN